MKKFKIIFKSLLVLILTIMMSITSLGVNTNTISAGNATDGYDIEIYHGYGRRVSSGYELSVLNGSDGDYKFSAKTAANGYNNNGPSSGTTNRYDQAPQGDIASVDFYYGGQMLTAYAVTASGTNCIKSNFYLNSNGVLCKTNDNVTSWPSTATTKLVGFAASKAGNTNSMASRWFNVPGDIKVVIHYHNEHTITVSGVDDVTINEEYDTYFTNKDATNKIMETIISNDYSNSTGITQSFEPLTENPLAGATITVGSNTPVNINGASGIYYLSSANTLSTTHESTDILAINFSNNQIIYYKVNDNINISFIYEFDITFDPNGGIFSDETTANKVISTENTIIATLPSGLTKTSLNGKVYEFDGWYKSTNYLTSEKVVDGTSFDENTTLYAKWKETYKVTFLPMGGEIAQDNDYAFTNIDTNRLSSSDIKTLTSYTRIDPNDENITYHFKGWYDNKAGLYTNDHLITSDYEFSADSDVYGIWENNYKITFDINGAYYSDDSTDNKILYTDTVNYDGKLSNLPATKLEYNDGIKDYYFLGWYTSNSEFIEANRVTVDTVFNENTTVYAGYTDERETVNFYANGELYTSKIVGKGLTVGVPNTNPTKDGYTFVGWYLDDGTFANKYDFSSTVDANLQLYASFKETVYVTVSGAYNVDLNDDAVEASDVVEFSKTLNRAKVIKGEDFGSKLKIYIAHGTLQKIYINNNNFNVSTLLNGGIVYIDEDGNKQNSASSDDMMSISYASGDNFITVNILKVNSDTTIDLTYKNVNISFYADNELWAKRSIAFNEESSITKPSDPSKTPLKFVGWYLDDETFNDEFSFSGLTLLDDLNVYAKFSNEYRVEVYTGFSKTIGSYGFADAISGGLTKSAYSGYGTRKGEYKNLTTTTNNNKYSQATIADIETIDFYYTISGQTKKVSTTDPSTWEITSGTTSKKYSVFNNPTNDYGAFNNNDINTTSIQDPNYLAVVRNEGGNLGIWLINLQGDLDIVMNYKNEKTINVKNVLSADINEGYDKYYRELTNTNEYTTRFFPYAGDGIEMNVSPLLNSIDNIVIKYGNKSATIDNGDLDKTLYLNANYEFVEEASESDILKYENNKFTYYKIQENIVIEYAYKYLITLNPDKGSIVNDVTSVYTVNGKIDKPELVSETVTVDEVNWYFAGWYDSNNNLVDFNNVLTADDTFTATWSNVPTKNIVVKNALSADTSHYGIVTTSLSDYILFDGSSGAAKIKSDANANMSIYADYGTLASIDIKLSDDVNVNIDAKEFVINDTKYIASDGSIEDNTFAGYKISITKNSNTEYYLVFSGLENDVNITLNYDDLNVNFLYEDDSAALDAVVIPFNTKVEKPADLEIDGYFFDGWFSDKTFTNEFDFTKALLDDQNIYVKRTVKHTLKYINATPSTTSSLISSSDWDSKVGAGLFDKDNAIAYTRGDFNNTSGVQTIFNAAASKPIKITFEYNGHTLELTGDDIEKQNNIVNDGYLLLDDGTFVANDGVIGNNVLAKYVHAKDYDNGGTYYNLRYYNINYDVTVTIEYEEVTVNYIDDNDATLVFNVDTKTAGTVIGEDGRSFTVNASELKGDNANSIRIAIDPKLSMVRGLRFVDKNDETNYEDFLFTGEKNYDQTLTKFGNIKVAYSIATETSATDGILYVRFLKLNKSVNVLPIILEDDGSHTVTLEMASDLYATYDNPVVSGVSVSNNNKTITVDYGALYKVTTSAEVGPSSFRWNLAPTAGYDLEYSKMEIIDADTDAVLATLGEDFASYAIGSDQTRTLMNFNNGVFVKYNKAKDSSAQIRVWAVSKDVKLKIYYKDFNNAGSDVDPSDAEFNGFEAKITLKQLVNDAKKSTVKFSFVTNSTKIYDTNETIDNKAYNLKSVVVNTADLTGSDAEIRKEGDTTICGIVRYSLTDAGKYLIKKVTISTSGENPVIYELTANQTINDPKIGQIKYARNTTDSHIRFNHIYTHDEILITVEYDSLGDGPYKGALEVNDKLNLSLDANTPKSVTVSKDNKTVSVPEDALKEGVNGKSLYWYLSSTAASDFEYSKIEVYLYDTKTKTYVLEKTLGEENVSYKTYKNGESDQTRSAALVGLSIRYNKSKYGEAQIRVWNVYKNFKIKVFYKNYATGEEYAANDSHLDFKYEGVVTLSNTRTLDIELDNNKYPITKLNGVYKIRYNKYLSVDDGVKYIVKPTVLGDNIDYITITVNGKSYDVGKDINIYKATTKTYPGAKVRFARSTDGSVQLRVYALSVDVDIEFHVSHGHKYVVNFDIGDHGTFRMADMPASARVLDKDLKRILVPQGATYNSKAGNKTSIRYDVTPDFGYDIDYIIFTVNGETYRLDDKELPNGTTLKTQTANGVAIRYNVDSVGIAQIRVVHLDANCSIKVYYREVTHKVTMNTQKLAVIRAEGYNLGSKATFTPNYAVTYVPGGATYARQNGIKYWFAPLEGHEITSIMIEDTYGYYVTAGGNFAPTEWEDVKVKGVNVRYYQGYDGKIELRVWGITDNIKITLFYDGEQPHRGVRVPDDIETYDIGIYEEVFDNKTDIPRGDDNSDPIEDIKPNNNLPLIIGGSVVGAGAIGSAIYILIKKLIKK